MHQACTLQNENFGFKYANIAGMASECNQPCMGDVCDALPPASPLYE
jgi:hypothetical protein